MNWIKLSDRKPENESSVLVTEGNDIELVWYHQYTYEDGEKQDRWDYLERVLESELTHWMPEPELPK